jgi:hypothetical protein
LSQLDIPAIPVSISAAVTLKRLSTYTLLNFNVTKWAVFLSDTFFKSFSSKYVYVEAASTTVAPSISNLSRILQFNVLYMLLHPQFIKNISDNSFLTRPGSAITQVLGAGGGGDDGYYTSE